MVDTAGVRSPRCVPLAVLACALAGCTFDPMYFAPAADSGVPEDAAPRDAAPRDAGSEDVGPPADGGGGLDAEVPDAGRPDAGAQDAEPVDATPIDAGPPDAGPLDAGPTHICGDGVVEEPEEACDTAVPGDPGCVACQVANGYTCVSSPSLCVPTSRVVWVDPATPDCDLDSGPFCTVTDGLEAAGPDDLIVVLPGTYAESLDLRAGASVRLVAPRGATLVGDGLAVHIHEDAVVFMAGFHITSPNGGAVKVENMNTEATLLECVLGPSAGLGLELKSGARLWLRRSVVEGNPAGGLHLDSSDGYTVMNTVITGNGANTDVGGVRIKKTSGLSAFVNNSVANNTAVNQAGGVWCETQATLLNLVVWGNRGVGTTGVSDTCVVRHSLLQDTKVGAGNITSDPQFVDARLHLAGTSPARDAADPAGVLPIGPAPADDHHRVPRPQGPRVDMGAYEAR